MTEEKQPPSDSRQRLDKWLFFARMAKSRSIAQRRIAAGDVRVNDQKILQASHTVRAGDRVVLVAGARSRILVVKAAGVRRGPYEEARQLYDDVTPAEQESQPSNSFGQAIRRAGTGRPTKKERRVLDELRSDGDWWSD
ncbi:heat shock protein Hsp15 [Ciceribacter lividus]|uniref:Heat shock protein Hsp15 n=1 Tax=Ciceribacter lividus TaxID=1197950 RepID=A0A6I7HP84_9HYPH|nr:RNA-binding S4 domain-containing protein [Ciceribacter lividus]RCW25895.1 heat shock protein Hsp15 [Ciceribacter lividus]